VLYELWQREGDELYTFVMMTTETNGAVKPVVGDKGRMPAVLRDEDWPKWLGEEDATLDELRDLLATREYELENRTGKKAVAPAQTVKTSTGRRSAHLVLSCADAVWELFNS